MDELRQYKERLRIALNAAKICIFEVDIQKQLYTFFENAEVIFGVPGDVILKEVQPFSRLAPDDYRQACSEYFSHPEDEETIQVAFARILNGQPAVYEARMKAGGSGFVWCRIHATPIIENGRPSRMIGVITDITELKETTESLKKAARLDDFTGLYKKGYTIAMIEKVLRRERELQYALVMIDIDNLKMVNDTYGHDEGDKMIQAVSKNLKKTFRKTDIIGRFGGDEFFILVRDMEDLQGLRGKLEELLHFQINGRSCTNSIGVACYPQDGTVFEALFKRADVALYHAKRSKGKTVFYEDVL